MGSLRDTIAASAPGDTIVFDGGVTGSIGLLSTLVIGHDLTVQGPGASVLALDGGNAVRVMDLTAGTLNVSGLTIRNANFATLGAGIAVTAGTLNVSDAVFTGNTAGNGAGIWVNAAASATVDNTTFSASTATAVGGAGIIVQGNLLVTRSTFEGNNGNINGAAINVQSGGVAVIANSTFHGNVSGSMGGAVSNLGTVTIASSTFSSNQGPGGSAFATGSASNTLYNNVFADHPDPAFNTTTWTDSGNNVFFNGGTGDATGWGTTDFVVAAAQPLQPLGNNGGPTLTMLPVSGGAATCAGSIALLGGFATDQRGMPRTTTVAGSPCLDAGSVQAANVIDFPNPGPQPLNASPTLTASASSGLPVTFTSATPAICSVTLGGTLTFHAPGMCTINADQAGDATHAAATQVSQSFMVVAVATTFTGPSATGSGMITASFTGGGAFCTFATSQFIPVTGHPASPPDGSAPAAVVFPHGLFDFTLTGCAPGSVIRMTITYPSVLPPATQYWKYGPTPGNPVAHWYTLPTAVAVGNTVTFEIQDGQIGDDDLMANGTIVDQGGPGAPAMPGPVQTPTLSEWALLLLSLAMLGFASTGGRLRRR